MANPVPIISDIASVIWLPAAGVAPADNVDLSCFITEPPADEVSFDTVSTPTLCNPQGSVIKVGDRTLTLSFLWTPEFMTIVEPLFGDSGTLTWRLASVKSAGYAYATTWPTTYGISGAFGEVFAVPVTFGVQSRTPVAALP